MVSTLDILSGRLGSLQGFAFVDGQPAHSPNDGRNGDIWDSIGDCTGFLDFGFPVV